MTIDRGLPPGVPSEAGLLQDMLRRIAALERASGKVIGTELASGVSNANQAIATTTTVIPNTTINFAARDYDTFVILHATVTYFVPSGGGGNDQRYVVTQIDGSPNGTSGWTIASTSTVLSPFTSAGQAWYTTGFTASGILLAGAAVWYRLSATTSAAALNISAGSGRAVLIGERRR